MPHRQQRVSTLAAQDKVFDVLPLFHSFGLTVGLVLPLISGVPYLSLSITIALSHCAGTGLRGECHYHVWHRHFPHRLCPCAHPYDFRSLRYILAGAEAVKETTRRIYLEKFGLRILEGYGVTETSPALALNTPMFNKFGTVGRLLPGMETRLEKVEGVTRKAAACW